MTNGADKDLWIAQKYESADTPTKIFFVIRGTTQVVFVTHTLEKAREWIAIEKKIEAGIILGKDLADLKAAMEALLQVNVFSQNWEKRFYIAANPELMIVGEEAFFVIDYDKKAAYGSFPTFWNASDELAKLRIKFSQP
ncbi:hypothetical protein [Polaromonas glacialis]|uniref:hypothetical protein n=1 Tax=Polaromonas glacialis TaxID=866564 RepID=UPI0004957C9E|nr:hypothetical protein [Polaromonas glacialis]